MRGWYVSVFGLFENVGLRVARGPPAPRSTSESPCPHRRVGRGPERVGFQRFGQRRWRAELKNTRYRNDELARIDLLQLIQTRQGRPDLGNFCPFQFAQGALRNTTLNIAQPCLGEGFFPIILIQYTADCLADQLQNIVRLRFSSLRVQPKCLHANPQKSFQSRENVSIARLQNARHTRRHIADM